MLTPTPRPLRLLYGAIALVFIIQCLLYIFHDSIVIDGRRWFVLFDDAMISMSYARTLAGGHGLVWFPGADRVEGFSNPLWTLFMALVHLLPVDERRTSLWIQLTGVILLAANLWCVRGLARQFALELFGRPREGIALASTALTAFYYPLNEWALQGMEVGLLVLLVTAAAWRGLIARRRGRADAGLFLLLGAGLWTRIDMLVPALAILAWLLMAIPATRRRTLLLFCLLALLPFLAQFLLRRWYYGDWLPNTYYLKVSGIGAGIRVGRGLLVLGEFLMQSNPLFLLCSLIPPAVLGRRGTGGAFKGGMGLALGLITGQFAYSVWVGGDAWEFRGGANRYLAIVIPLVMILSATGLAMLMDVAARQSRNVRFWRAAHLLVLLGCMFHFATQAHAASVVDALLMRQPFQAPLNARMIRVALAVKAITTPEAKVAVAWAGIIPYFSERPAVDLLGKMDRHIARLPPRFDPTQPPRRSFYPGHVKWDLRYSIEMHRPDAIVQLWDHSRASMMLDMIPPEVADLVGDAYDMRVARGERILVARASRAIVNGSGATPPAAVSPSPPQAP